jgi:hypothetical protein
MGASGRAISGAGADRETARSAATMASARRMWLATLSGIMVSVHPSGWRSIEAGVLLFLELLSERST